MLTEREICELQQIQLYPQRQVNLPLIKGSPLRELFKLNLQLMKENGLNAYHHARNYILAPKCNKKSSNHAEPIYLADVKFAFQLLAVGVAASVFMLAWEVAFRPLTTSLSAAIDTKEQLIHEFLQQKSIKSFIALHCFQEPADRDMIRIIKTLHQTFAGTVYSIDMNKKRGSLMLQKHSVSSAGSRNGIITNMECSRIEQLFEESSLNSYFNASFHWLIFGGHDRDRADFLMRKQNINIDSIIMLALRDSENHYRIFDVYGTVKRRGGKVTLNHLGIKSSNTTLPSSTYTQRNLHGIKLKAVVSLILAHSWRYDLLGQNTSIGVIGQLQMNEVDFSAFPIAMLPERCPYFDGTLEIYRSRIWIIFRHPKTGGEGNIYLLPFRASVWISLFAVLVIVMVLLPLSNYLDRLNTPSEQSFRLSVLEAIAIICQQGTSTSSRSNRIVIISFVLLTLLLYQFYTTFFVGYQLIVPPKTINSLEQLIDSDITVTIEDIAYNHEFFRRTNYSAARKLYETKISSNQHSFINVSVGVQLVKQGGYAFGCDTSYAYSQVLDTFTEREICELHQVQLYPQRTIHLPVPKGSPLRESFRLSLLQLKSNGLIAYFWTKNVQPTPSCNLHKSHHTEPILLRDLASALCLLCAGFVLSVLMLVLEIVATTVHRWYNNRQ
uniref:Uncharacterized protein n=1 Tax=Anopheles dirus TaxID=7168 RepID=A0A182N505_9DIPT